MDFSRSRIVLTLCLCFIECVLFGGNLSAWTIFTYVLKRDGIFASDCTENSEGNITATYFNISKGSTTNIPQTASSGYNQTALEPGRTWSTSTVNTLLDQTSCSAQDSHLSLAYTLSTVVNGVIAFPAGSLLDHFGLRITRSVASLLALSGYMVLGFTGPQGHSWLTYPGCIFMGVSCFLIIMTNCHVCGLAGRHASKCVSLYNGGVNAAISFLIIKTVYERGIPRLHSISVLTSLWSIVLFTTFVLLPKDNVYNTFDATPANSRDNTASNTERPTQKDKTNKLCTPSNGIGPETVNEKCDVNLRRTVSVKAAATQEAQNEDNVKSDAAPSTLSLVWGEEETCQKCVVENGDKNLANGEAFEVSVSPLAVVPYALDASEENKTRGGTPYSIRRNGGDKAQGMTAYITQGVEEEKTRGMMVYVIQESEEDISQEVTPRTVQGSDLKEQEAAPCNIRGDEGNIKGVTPHVIQGGEENTTQGVAPYAGIEEHTKQEATNCTVQGSETDKTQAGQYAENRVKETSATPEIVNSPARNSDDPSLRDTVFSLRYLLYLYWFCVLFLRISWYLNSYNTWITEIVKGNIEEVSFFTSMFGYSQISGIIVAPLAGIYMDHRRKAFKASGLGTEFESIRPNPTTIGGKHRVIAAVPSVAFTCVVAVGVSVGALFTNKISIYVSLFTAECFRSFLFATSVAILEISFPAKQYGKLFGLQFAVSGAFSFVMYPLSTWAQSNDLGFTQVNTFLLVLVVTSVVFPAYVVLSHIKYQKGRSGVCPADRQSCTT